MYRRQRAGGRGRVGAHPCVFQLPGSYGGYSRWSVFFRVVEGVVLVAAAAAAAAAVVVIVLAVVAAATVVMVGLAVVAILAVAKKQEKK